MTRTLPRYVGLDKDCAGRIHADRIRYVDGNQDTRCPGCTLLTEHARRFTPSPAGMTRLEDGAGRVRLLCRIPFEHELATILEA